MWLLSSLWIFVVCFTAVMVEILCCNMGIILPGALFVSYYVMVCHGIPIGAVAGAAACVVVEVALGRPFTAMPLLLPLVALGYFWRHYGDRRSMVPQALSGILIGITYALFCNGFGGNPMVLLLSQGASSLALDVAVTAIMSALWLPGLVVAWDAVSSIIGSDTFRARARVQYKHDQN